MSIKKCPKCNTVISEEYLVQRTAQAYQDGYMPYTDNHSITVYGECKECKTDFMFDVDVKFEMSDLELDEE